MTPDEYKAKYGYDESAEDYNILYFMHGGGGSPYLYFTPGETSALSNMLDHMIQDELIEPIIVAAPSFYPPDDNDSSVSNAGRLVERFPAELTASLMPAVESTYRTYATDTTEEGFRASRDHRAFGGFSMGSVTTWYVFLNNLDYFSKFMPLSGDCRVVTGNVGNASTADATAQAVEAAVSAQGYTADDFLIYALAGTSDIAYDALNSQMEAMMKLDTFRFGENTFYGLMPGGTHNHPEMRKYIYEALRMFWPASEDTASTSSGTTIRMTFDDGTVAYMTDVRDHATARAFVESLPMTVRFSDWDGREYWYSDTLPYDEDSVLHTYAIGEFTYWCGGWVTAYYNTNEDTVIEAGSVVIGMMDDTAVQQFASANGASRTITFELVP